MSSKSCEVSTFSNIDLVYKLLLEGALLLDIRTSEEYCKSHICGSSNIDTRLPPLSSQILNNLEKRLSKKLEPYCYHHPIIVYCKKGIRSKKKHATLSKS